MSTTTGEQPEPRGHRPVDHELVRQLNQRVGELRRQAVERRRRAGEALLSGEDARQHDRALVVQVVEAYVAERGESGELVLSWERTNDLRQALEARMFGAGSLEQLLADDTIENVNINGHAKVFITYADGTKDQWPGPICESDEQLVEEIKKLAAHEGLSARAFDEANVRVNLRLSDGSRLYAVMAVSKAPMVSIRRNRFPEPDLKKFVANGTMDQQLADFLSAAVRAKKNIMIAGETGSGKTTLLRSLAREIDPWERIITVERTLELGLDEDTEFHKDCVALEERPANAEGRGAEPMRQLVQDSLRMQPDRVFVGEVLGDEVIEMLTAMTQGNNGSLSTLHADGAHEVIGRLQLYALKAPERLPFEATASLITHALHLVVFLRWVRLADGGRRRVVESVRSIGSLQDGEVKTNELWGLDSDGVVRRRESVSPHWIDQLREVGWSEGTQRGWA